MVQCCTYNYVIEKIKILTRHNNKISEKKMKRTLSNIYNVSLYDEIHRYTHHDYDILDYNILCTVSL
jgi:hypothetical protein